MFLCKFSKSIHTILQILLDLVAQNPTNPPWSGQTFIYLLRTPFSSVFEPLIFHYLGKGRVHRFGQRRRRRRLEKVTSFYTNSTRFTPSFLVEFVQKLVTYRRDDWRVDVDGRRHLPSGPRAVEEWTELDILWLDMVENGHKTDRFSDILSDFTSNQVTLTSNLGISWPNLAEFA